MPILLEIAFVTTCSNCTSVRIKLNQKLINERHNERNKCFTLLIFNSSVLCIILRLALRLKFGLEMLTRLPMLVVVVRWLRLGDSSQLVL